MKFMIICLLSMANLFYLSSILSSLEIKWMTNRKVTLDDFKSKFDYGGGSTNICVYFTYKEIAKSDSLFVLDIYSYFEPESSYVSKLSLMIWAETGVSTLNHEQRHFDIDEINARILKSKIPQTNSKTKIGNLIDSLLNKQHEFFVAEEFKYDSLTEHGSNDAIQSIWNAKIDSTLDRYKKFMESKIVIKLR